MGIVSSLGSRSPHSKTLPAPPLIVLAAKRICTVNAYVVCLKSKCTDFLFKCLLDSPEITNDHLQSMTLGKLDNGYNVFSTDHSNTGSHFL